MISPSATFRSAAAATRTLARAGRPVVFSGAARHDAASSRAPIAATKSDHEVGCRLTMNNQFNTIQAGSADTSSLERCSARLQPERAHRFDSRFGHELL